MTTMPDEPIDTVEDAVLAEAALALDDLVQPEEIASMEQLDSPRRLLLVHAHPDDETIGNGVTMAKYVADGALVTLVTCTLGEEGEVLVPELAHLAADRDDVLGQHRVGELATAMEALGVTDHRFLGGAGRYRDSGMMGEPSNERPECFWQADLDEAAGHLVEVIRQTRPQVLATYDPNGGYGHPDHIQAHRVATRAVELAADPAFGADEPWQVSKLYWNAVPESRTRDMVRALREAGDTSTFAFLDAEGELPPFVVPDELITAVIDGESYVGAKLAAMRSYPTQIAADGSFFALSDQTNRTIWSTEAYRLVAGERGPGDGPGGVETDLFAGVQ